MEMTVCKDQYIMETTKTHIIYVGYDIDFKNQYILYTDLEDDMANQIKINYDRFTNDVEFIHCDLHTTR